MFFLFFPIGTPAQNEKEKIERVGEQDASTQGQKNKTWAE